MQTLKTKTLVTFFILFSSIVAQSQQLNPNWKQDLNNALQEFEKCETSECYEIYGLSLNGVYKVNDFYSNEKNRYLTTSEIKSYLDENGNWEKLGPAYDAKALEKAQSYANNKKATVAVYLNDNGKGHVALIIPGDLSPSGSWRLNVPNSASFFIGDPSKSYVGKGLSYAFARDLLKDVVVYGRKY